MKPEDLEQLIHSRRSSLLIDAHTPVKEELLQRLCEAAQYAPNHKRTWPLRIAIISGDSRGVLGNTIADAMTMHGDDEAKIIKARTKYMRSPAVFVIASAVGTTESETEENRYAVAAGIQNMLLLAESFGLSALWGSPTKGANDAVTRLCNMDTTDHIIGLIYIGWPSGSVPPVERPAVVVNKFD